jgi:L-malate glycosyltransferase
MEKKSGNENAPVFAAFFPSCENVHLTKDVGSIPYVLHRDYGYRSFLICYQNGEYEDSGKETPGIEFLFMKRGPGYAISKSLKKLLRADSIPIRGVESLCTVLDALPVLLKHRKHIDVLQVYHLDDESILLSWLYHLINNRGIVYLKLDMDPDLCLKDDKKRRSFIYRKAPIDIMSIETREVLEFMKNGHSFFKSFRNNLFYVPNGVDVRNMMPNVDTGIVKEKTILHVGRIGTYQKASEIILDAFASVAQEFPEWKLKLIGPMEKDFYPYFKDFLEKNPGMKDRISYAGVVSKKDLYSEYNRAKILALPSRFESFGLVVAEAGLFNTVSLASDILPIRELTDNGKLAYLCPIGNTRYFSDTLRYMISHEEELAGKSSFISQYICRNFDWSLICCHLNDRLREKMGGRH